ncbi:MAG: YkuS family protein [Eubacteriales bacterium]
MILAIDDKHKKIASALNEMGYTLTNVASKSAVNAILYDSSMDGNFLDTINNVNMVSGVKDDGVLLIDIKGKDAQEIHRIVSRRLYSPLF